MDGEVTIKTSLDTKSFDAQIRKVEEELNDLERAYKLLKETEPANSEILKTYAVNIEKAKNKLIELNKKQLELNQTPVVDNKIGEAIGENVKKMSKWALAVFSIRSAYMLIRQSANQLADSNEAIAGKLNAIKGSLANAIAPIAETLVNLAFKLLAYLNVITKTFLGVDLFKKTAKSAKSAVGSANKLRKTIAGFDEMNVLNDNTSGGGGGGGLGTTPEPELPDTSGFQKWIEDTKAKWQELLDISRTEAAQLFLETDKTWGLLKLGWFDTIQGLAKIVTGFLDVVEGVWGIIVGITEGDNEKIKESVLNLVEGIGGILTGLLQVVLGILEMIVGAIWGALKSLVEWIYNKIIKPIGNFFKNLWDGVVTGVTNAVNKIKSAFNNVVTFFSNIVNKIKDTFKKVGSKAGEIVSSAFKAVVNGVLKAMESILNTPINAINKLIGVINKVPGINLGKLNTFNLPRLAKGGIINMPGRGVPIGQAIGGERGQEGIIPLTDSQQMALLGEAIGKYININATIINQMNGRVISRELQKINTDNNFASNN